MNTAVNGKYVLERRLGGGGMAEVFLARTLGAEGFSRTVAIKRVLSGFSDNPEFARLFVSEAQLSSRLQHSNVVSVLDFDRDHEGRLFLVMELVNGIDLDGLLGTGALPFSLVISLAIEILRGLDYAHELPLGTDGVRGVVHRDISPHNVLLSWDGSVKVSDFGIAKPRAATNATASHIIKGKPAYMSPEQARGFPLDGRSDVFAVGVMLFEMLCLRPLFSGTTTEETLSRLFFEPIPVPRALRPEIPEDLSRVVASLLQRERDDRPTANAAIAALCACADFPRDGREELIRTLAQRFIGRAPVRAREVSHASPAAATMRHTLAPPRNLRPRPERQRLWVLLASLLVLGGIGAGVAWLRGAGPNGTVTPLAVEPAPPAAPAPAVPAPAARGVTAPRPPPGASTQAAAGAGSADAPAPAAPKVPAAPKALGDGQTLEDGSSPQRRPPARSTPAARKPDGIREIHLGAAPGR